MSILIEYLFDAWYLMIEIWVGWAGLWVMLVALEVIIGRTFNLNLTWTHKPGDDTT